MKTTQAWGWLAAGVLALGLNGAYQDGAHQDGAAAWAHRAIERAVQQTTAVLALASGRADQFLAEARALTARDETASCRLVTALARIQTSVARSETGLARVETLSARQEAQLARFEANRTRMEAQLAAKTARIRMAAVSFNTADFNTVDFSSDGISSIKAPVCPRVRVSVPRPPMIKIPVIRVETTGLGPL